MKRMNAWTFSRKVSVFIAVSVLIVSAVVSGFVYITFKNWTERQERDLLNAKLKQIELQIGELKFLPSLLRPGLSIGKKTAAYLKPDLSALQPELDEGQHLQLFDSKGELLAEVSKGESINNPVNYTVKSEFNLLVYGPVKLQLTDNGYSRSATAEREIGRLLLLGLFITAGLGILAGGIVARSALKPIRTMIQEVQNIGTSNLNQRLHLPNAKDELHQLGETFNGFLHKLDISFEQQRRFVADASHELKTPLAIIEGHTRMIQRWGKKSPEILDESLDFMMNETNRMKELISQLLLLAEMESSAPSDAGEVSDLKETLRELISQSVHVNPEVTLIYEESPSIDQILIQMPKAASYQALRNIVENALKYTPEHGTVTIEVMIRDAQIIVTVKDTGIGIPADQLPHIFDRFYRTESSRNRTNGGSGLGLAITKTIMERYGGSVVIDSNIDQGTKVTLYFIKV